MREKTARLYQVGFYSGLLSGWVWKAVEQLLRLGIFIIFIAIMFELF